MKSLFLTIFIGAISVSHGSGGKRLNRLNDCMKNHTTQQLRKPKTLNKKPPHNHTTKQYVLYCLTLAGVACCGYLFYSFLNNKGKPSLDKCIRQHNKDVDKLMSKIQSLEDLDHLGTLNRRAQELEKKVNELNGTSKKPFIKKCTLTDQRLGELINQHHGALSKEMKNLLEEAKTTRQLKAIADRNRLVVTAGAQGFKQRGKLYNKRANILSFLQNSTKRSNKVFIKNCTDKLNELLNMPGNDNEKQVRKQYILCILNKACNKRDFAELFPGFTTNIDHKNFNPQQYNNRGNRC